MTSFQMSADIFSCGSVLKKQTSIKYWQYIIDFISTNFLLWMAGDGLVTF